MKIAVCGIILQSRGQVTF